LSRGDERNDAFGQRVSLGTGEGRRGEETVRDQTKGRVDEGEQRIERKGLRPEETMSGLGKELKKIKISSGI